jgi:uncharacterized protein YndB with AHSA1/START domain
MKDYIEKNIDLNAPIDRVWRALTDHEEFGRWFRVELNQPFVVGELSTGHITYPGYEHVKWEATVREMEEPRLFSFTWPHPADFNAPDYHDEPTTLVEFRLEETANGTRVTVTESGFEALPPERQAEAMRSNEGGWEEQMRNIKAHVDG